MTLLLFYNLDIYQQAIEKTSDTAFLKFLFLKRDCYRITNLDLISDTKYFINETIKGRFKSLLVHLNSCIPHLFSLSLTQTQSEVN